jgi:hypothetical protein
VDHLISLELGGADVAENLWPQSYDTVTWNAHTKDKLEDRLHALVCAGRLPLEQAQRDIATDWIAGLPEVHWDTVRHPRAGATPRDG